MKSMSKSAAWLAASVVMVALVSNVRAQSEIRPGCPFVDAFEFDHDLQYFERFDPAMLGDVPAPSTGWFGAYDRAYLSISRPDKTLREFSGDWTWGNRYDVGYMTEEGHGWLGTFWRITGPTVIARFEVDELDKTTGQVAPTNTIFLDDTRNVAHLNSWALDKTFRFGPLYHGGFLEPYVGIRFMELQDKSWLMNESHNIPVTGTATQIVDRVLVESTNNLLGAEFGSRWFKTRGHWNLSADVKMLIFQNWQFLTSENNVLTISYTAPALTETRRERQITQVSENFSNLSYAMEIRSEAAYEITRDVSLRVGLEVLQFYRGISRGIDAFNTHQQHFTAVGATFGVTVNR